MKRMRMVAPLLAVLVGLFATQNVSASNCGAGKYNASGSPCCDAQSCFSSATGQMRENFRLVVDNVLGKRWLTSYTTVQETTMKQVTKTCYKDEARTCYKKCYETVFKNVEEQVQKKVVETAYKDCEYTVCKPVKKTCMNAKRNAATLFANL